MKKIILFTRVPVVIGIIGILSATIANSQSPNWQWAKSAGGTGVDEFRSVATDNIGNVYVTGYFTSLITFGPFTLTDSGGGDIFIVKFDKNGNVLRAKSEGGTNWDESFGIAIDSSGNVYLTG